MWCLIGLGNPGERYHQTRHNVGFDVIDELSHRWNIPVNHSSRLFHFGSGDFQDIPVLLVKPITFMNRSGAAYRRLLQDEAVSTGQTLVIYDELQLPLAKIRLRSKGSAGGHNGLQSIIDAAKTNEIPRLRIGIDGMDEDWVDFVLQPFARRERKEIDLAIVKAAETVEILLLEGMEKAMNVHNR